MPDEEKPPPPPKCAQCTTQDVSAEGQICFGCTTYNALQRQKDNPHKSKE